MVNINMHIWDDKNKTLVAEGHGEYFTIRVVKHGIVTKLTLHVSKEQMLGLVDELNKVEGLQKEEVKNEDN